MQKLFKRDSSLIRIFLTLRHFALNKYILILKSHAPFFFGKNDGFYSVFSMLVNLVKNYAKEDENETNFSLYLEHQHI